MIPFIVPDKKLRSQNSEPRSRRWVLLTVLALCLCASVAFLWATSTPYTQGFSSGHGWSWTQVSCGGTCTNGDNASDGNPSPSVFAKIVGKNKTMVGYWSRSYTWQDLGVPAGETVSTVNGTWDSKQVHVTGNCSSSATVGMDLYDSANTTRITASQIEANIDVSADSGWTAHDPTGTINVLSAYQASGTTITLRLNSNPAGNATTNADCELRTDNYKLTITSTAPSGRKSQTIVAGADMRDFHQTVVTFGRQRFGLEHGWLWGVKERLDIPILSIEHGGHQE